MTDSLGRDEIRRRARFLVLLLVPCALGTGCGLDKGSSGDIPPQNIFLEAQGCLLDEPGLEDATSLDYSFPSSEDLPLMEVKLEVLRGQVDLVLGASAPPSDYFGFGRGTGTQKILVGRQSFEPVMLRPWFVSLDSGPLAILEECEEGDDPDWRLLVSRSTGPRGRGLLSQEGRVPASTPGNIVHEEVQVEVPEDALSMEIVLESLGEGDADLLVGLGSEVESLVSLNLGPGYDVVVIGEQKLVPLRGESISAFLESWGAPTDYRLEATYTPGEVDQEEE